MGFFARLPAVTAVFVLLGSGHMAGAPAGNEAVAAMVAPESVEAGEPIQAAPRGAFGLRGQIVQGGVVIGAAPRGTTMLTFNGDPVTVARDGAFLIAFDRDAGPGAQLVATLENGSRIAETLSVAPRAWNISRLPTLPKYPVPTAEFQRLRPGELAQINGARRMQTDAEGWRQPFLWPVTGRISTRFGSQRIYAGEPGAYHSGVDVARPVGTVVIAPADGVVILATAKPFTLEGHLLMIDHGAGLNSAFMHLSRIDVTTGAHVRRGQPIGLVGATGRATGPHLHWGMKWRDARIDPLLLAGPMPAAE
ncbi:M23 family metallopeptidase [Sphingomonas sp. G-3-2-10]|uniref:M23 family metallopeptidase n=1 Tax=Sphingomonas sp. G-3-2-10 TaxID=2728838 RepID=UPI00146AD000|nr:M23 family metallopeptidase [Sphingomonas sp. G-3-2-10]NML07043.1 M23 family metallopeptidase [Sphingomonas sp. G-3-2-10]